MNAAGGNRRAFAFGIALLLLASSAARADYVPADPYAKSLIGPLKEQYQDIVDEARMVINGWKCSVIHPNRSWLEVQMDENYVLQNLVNAGIGSEAAKLHAGFEAAIKEGQAGGCDYWHKHPDAVLVLRQTYNY
jgi:hypothetical protein